MGNESLVEPKQRILDAAIILFSKKGFAAVGVREIARYANVNIAMISYYYEGKVGILKAVMERFFDQYFENFQGVEEKCDVPEECVSMIVHNLVNFVRNNTELAMVAYNELPLDIPEIAELKAQKISHLITKLRGLISGFNLDPDDVVQIGMIGPALISMIFMNFRIRPLLKQIFHIEFDDSYHEKLTQTITTLFLEGAKGLANRRQGQQRIRIDP